MSTPLQALYFDGRAARGQPVRLCVEGGALLAQHAHEGAAEVSPPLRWPLTAVQWPERTRHGQRVIHLADGGSLQCADGAAFDAWRQTHGARETWVVRAQQNWRATLLATLALVAVLAAGYGWGVPLLARAAVAALPASADAAVGAAAFGPLEQRWLRPSVLSAARQQQLSAAFASMVQRGYAAPERPAYRLEFRAAGAELGPNAFALPGGTIVLTDALVELLDGHDDTLLGVLAHELGHVRLRHGMRSVAQVTLLGVVTGLALGDFSAVLAGAPALLGQMAYARSFEQEADAEAVRLLRAAGLQPASMVVLFERLNALNAKAGGGRSRLPIAFASHPADEDRVRFFREAGTR